MSTHPNTEPDPDLPTTATARSATVRSTPGPNPGLTSAEAAERLTRFGRNELPEPPRVRWWRRWLSAVREPLIVILLVAAGVSLVAGGDLKTPIVVLVVVMLNTVIGVVQEGRAERSLDALRSRSVSSATVRRDGATNEIDATELVPGDVVLVEAGDRVPADGRLLVAHRLEAEEAALTGESGGVSKSTEPVTGDVVALGDRTDHLFMQTTVLAGRGEIEVVATGSQTEVGRIATLLASGSHPDTPLQRQLAGLARSLAALAGVVVVVVGAIGLARGRSWAEVLDTAIALAIASIPEGLPAVTAVTLALGVQRMARRHAVVKRLAAVETLGCTTIICSDKTGTLTLNRMTATELVLVDRTLTADEVADASASADLDHEIDEALEALVLCSDAEVHDDGTAVGDPTETALVSLAARAGIDVTARRARRPRLAEVPFDSATKWMATFHDGRPDDASETIAPDATTDQVLVIVKGAPDVVDRAARRTGDGATATGNGTRTGREHDELAGRGRRVLAVATRRVSRAAFDDALAADRLSTLVDDLDVLALVGIVDPPRPEAAEAIAVAHRAGIGLRMITGDHAVTAAAIATDLGIPGRAVTGADLDTWSDEHLDRELEGIGVFARVSPEHKLRLVEAYQRRGDVVAMTGDGVNDAPALRRADIGVSMGITGTDVTNEAATMVLQDDNVSTIVHAVEEGRAIYAAIVAFVRFQLSTTIGFALLFVGAAITGVAGGAPFTAIAILWVNLIMDGPPAMALGVDPPEDDLMDREPRTPDQPILTAERWGAVVLAASTTAAGALAVLALAEESVATTMAFTTFVLAQFANLLNARSDRRSVVGRRTLRNRWLWLAIAVAAVLQVAVVHVGPLQRLFDTTSLTIPQWAVAAAVASSVIVVEEIRKAAMGAARRRRS